MIGAGNKTSLGGEVGSEAVGNSLGTIVGLPLAVIPPAESISPVTTSATMSTTSRGSDAHRGDSLRFHGGSEGGEGAGGARRLRRPLLISPVIFCELASVCGRILSSACQQLCPRKRAQAPMPRLRPDEDARQERSRMNLKVPSKGERTPFPSPFPSPGRLFPSPGSGKKIRCIKTRPLVASYRVQSCARFEGGGKLPREGG